VCAYLSLLSLQCMTVSSSGRTCGMHTCILRGPRDPSTFDAYSTTAAQARTHTKRRTSQAEGPDDQISRGHAAERRRLCALLMKNDRWAEGRTELLACLAAAGASVVVVLGVAAVVEHLRQPSSQTHRDTKDFSRPSNSRPIPDSYAGHFDR
jgi:hypothetical protein